MYDAVIPLYSNIEEKFKEFERNGYTIVLITNQANIEIKKTTVEQTKAKIEKVFELCGVNIIIFVAGYYDYFRKPSAGTFEYLQRLSKTPLSKENVFYCGDAYGSGKSKKQSDYLYSVNCGIRFYTPESVFKSKTLLPSTPFVETLPSFNPSELPHTMSDKVRSVLKEKEEQEVVLLIGPPACGKSTISNTYFSSYVRINQDTLGTPGKCKKAAEVALNAKKSIIVDNTNGTRNARSTWIKMTTTYNLPVRAIVIETTKDVVKHLNNFRSFGFNEDHRRVPQVAINSFFAHYEAPVESEGISNIEFIPFIRKEFENKEEEKAFKYYLE